MRSIVIDGSNIAVEHAKEKLNMLKRQRQDTPTRRLPVFSSEGILNCVKYFKERGHRDIVVFIPEFRLKQVKSDNQHILLKLRTEGVLKTTPSHEINNKIVNTYDDRFTLEYALGKDAVIVSNDNFRDLVKEDSKFKDLIHTRLLKFTWVDNTLMFPSDPRRKNGPFLDEFLRL